VGDEVQTGTVTTKVPARLDRLPWSRWHWMVVIGLGTVWILDGLVPATADLPAAVGWRLCFGLGVVLGLVVLLVRRNVPESPRWLFIHGRAKQAEQLVDRIEDRVQRETGTRLTEPSREITIRQRQVIGFVTIAKTMFRQYPRRTILGFSLFIGQAFLYNAITFGYAQILATFFHVTTNPGYYFAVIAVGNLFGPLLLGRLFDTLGRKPMIAGTYIGSGLALLLTAYLFHQGLLDATTMTACWCGVLFLASAGASSAYLTVSEVFPMETRALAIAFFYALGTAAGGVSGPLLFSSLVSTGSVSDTAIAFVIGAALMIGAGLVEVVLGVKAERQSLEDIARPLTAQAGSGRSAQAEATT
jgi:MFS family permease